MKKSKKIRVFDDQFRLRMLKEYYEGSECLHAFCKRNDIQHNRIAYWERKYLEKVVSLPSDLNDLLNKVYMARDKWRKLHPVVEAEEKSEYDLLREENQRLRKALEYSELRNEALNEVLKIGREKYGVDLLKKVGAKQ
ncbi:MAG: transposase [Prevotella sp.]|jgi:transposase-like protein|nr:transposase [Prevotella sp.]